MDFKNINFIDQELLFNTHQINQKYFEILNLFVEKQHVISKHIEFFNHCLWNKNNISQILEQILSHPETVLQSSLQLQQDIFNLINNTVSRFMGQELFEDSNDMSACKDRRFKDSIWKENIYFDFIKNYYLLLSNWSSTVTYKFNFDLPTQKYFNFFIRQLLDAWSPSNFASYNPIVLKKFFETKGLNILNGLNNFIHDLKSTNNLFQIQATKENFFIPGQNIAITPGKVVMQNDLIQLICYEPKSSTYKIPLLIIPPWINKYYILDLSSDNSFVKWLVEKNYQVFIVSWVNPDKRLSHKGFEDYMLEGVIEPLTWISQNLGYKKINTIGYCIGGTLLASALAYLSAKQENIINSATFFTTLLDFEDVGDFSLIINQQTIGYIENLMQESGVFNGEYMSSMFSLLRANDMIWSLFVNNYLLGNEPLSLDLLFWNSDVTNLTENMHKFYLKNMYIDNSLKAAGVIKFGGIPIDLSLIKNPVFFVSAQSDHIAPWVSTYKGYQFVGGTAEFCLAESGHIAGIVNPPVKNKYSYRINRRADKSAAYEEWLAGSQQYAGSWWDYWEVWQRSLSGALEKSMAYNRIHYIEDAPGSYVKVVHK